jgi:hypothetical protein
VILKLLTHAIALAAQLANAHVVYALKPDKQRAELWLMPGRAHLKSPRREVFWDLVKERRFHHEGSRNVDEPIVGFGRIVEADELFPRGWTLPRRGRKKILGKSCDLLTHKQEVPTSDGVVQSRFAWCVWKGVPLSLDYAVSVCKRGRCQRSLRRWNAVQLDLGVVKDEDVKRF